MFRCNMKSAITLAVLVFAAGLSAAAGGSSGVKWKDQAYFGEFCFIEESGLYDKDSWEDLAADVKEHELARAKAGARERYKKVRGYYSEMMQKWTLEDVSQKTERLDADSIEAVKLWLGPDHAAYLESKRAGLEALQNSCRAASLKESEVTASAPYLTPEAAAQLMAMVVSGQGPAQIAAQKQKRQAEMSDRVNGIKGAYGASLGSGGGKKFFDGAGRYAGSVDEPALKLPKGAGSGTGKIDVYYYRRSHATTVSGGAVPELYGDTDSSHKQGAFTPKDLERIDSVVADMKQKRQAEGADNGWLGNFKQSLGLSKTGSGCSDWTNAAVSAIKDDPVLSQKYEAGYVRGLRNPIGALTKWPPSVPIPLPHFVAVVWPKGTDPNETAIYVDSWAKDTKRGPIKDFTYEYSFDPKDLTPTVYYDTQVKKKIKLPGGKTTVVNETVEVPVPLINGNPWVFVK